MCDGWPKDARERRRMRAWVRSSAFPASPVKDDDAVDVAIVAQIGNSLLGRREEKREDAIDQDAVALVRPGMAQVKEQSPASTWATGVLARRAAIAPANALLWPLYEHEIGRGRKRHGFDHGGDAADHDVRTGTTDDRLQALVRQVEAGDRLVEQRVMLVPRM